MKLLDKAVALRAEVTAGKKQLRQAAAELATQYEIDERTASVLLRNLNLRGDNS